MNIRSRRAFTLAEMMVVLLIVSLVMAAFLPVITTRSKASTGSIWKYAANNSDIYFGTGATQGAVIGKNALDTVTSATTVSLTSRLQLETPTNSVKPHIILTNNGAEKARIVSLGTNNLGMGYQVFRDLNAGAAGGLYNVAFGDGALTSDTTGDDNTAIGYGAFTANTTGSDNVVVGHRALQVATNMTGNVAIGAMAMNARATNYNTVIGYSAAQDNQTGSQIVSIGAYSNATKINGVSIGYSASVIAKSSVAIGGISDGSGSDVHVAAEGGYSTAVGAGAQANSTWTTAFGCDSQASAQGSTAIGEASLGGGEGAVAIGSDAHIFGNYSVAIGSRASDEGDWLTHSIGDYSINIGYLSYSAAAANAIAIGNTALATAAGSIAIGNSSSLVSDNTVVIGDEATEQQGQYGNVVIGSLATIFNSDSGSNPSANPMCSTAIGFRAKADQLSTAIGGYWDPANPTQALGQSIAIGSGVFANWGSIAVGGRAGISNDKSTTSFGDIAVGGYAHGGRSISIGSDGAESSMPYAISIGSTALASNSNSIAIGNNAGATGNGSVAIGSVSDTYPNNTYATGDGAVAVGYNARAGNANAIAIGNGVMAYQPGSAAFGVDNNGNYAVGDTTNQINLGVTAHTVYIPGKLKVDGTTTINRLSAASLATNASGVIISSDRRLKNVNGKFTDGLDKIRQLNPYNFTYKKDKKKTPHVGIIAQELKKVFPNAVTKKEDGFLAIRQDDMFYAMINSIKQLDKIVQGLVNDLKSLVARVQHIEDKVAALIKVDNINAKKIKELEDKNKQLEARLKKLEKLVNK